MLRLNEVGRSLNCMRDDYTFSLLDEVMAAATIVGNFIKD